MYKYGVFSDPQFLVFGLNTEIYGVNLYIQSEYRKIRIRKSSVFVHFSRSASETRIPVDTQRRINIDTTSYDVVSTLKRRRVSKAMSITTLKQVISNTIFYVGAQPVRMFRV